MLKKGKTVFNMNFYIPVLCSRFQNPAFFSYKHCTYIFQMAWQVKHETSTIKKYARILPFIELTLCGLGSKL